MKHLSLILLGIFTFCFFGCQSPNESFYTPPNESFSTPPNESGSIPPSESDCTQQCESAGKGHFFPASWGGSLRNLPSDHYYEPGQSLDSTFILLSSEEEVHELLGEAYSVSYSEYDQDWVRDDRFESIIKKYDHGFFENNQVLTFFVTAAGSGYYFELNNITYQDDILTIELNHIYSGPGHDALVRWFALIEIEKISTETQEIIINNRGW